MGIPIICSRIAGNVDIINDNDTGLIFDDGNEQQMQHLINYALANPEAVKTMAKKLQAIIVDNYRSENIWQNILAAYKSSLN